MNPKIYEQSARMITVLLGSAYYVEGLPDIPNKMRITKLSKENPEPLDFDLDEMKIEYSGCTPTDSFLAVLLTSEAVKLLADFFDDPSILQNFNHKVEGKTETVILGEPEAKELADKLTEC